MRHVHLQPPHCRQCRPRSHPPSPLEPAHREDLHRLGPPLHQLLRPSPSPRFWPHRDYYLPDPPGSRQEGIRILQGSIRWHGRALPRASQGTATDGTARTEAGGHREAGRLSYLPPRQDHPDLHPRSEPGWKCSPQPGMAFCRALEAYEIRVFSGWRPPPAARIIPRLKSDKYA
jgi:hypothetical protein